MSGCAVKLFYEQIDWLVPWYLDRQLDLNKNQKEFLKTRLSEQLHWHRKTQIPEYVTLLADWQTVFLNPFSLNSFEFHSQRTQSYLIKATEHLLPDVNQFLLMLNSKQRHALYRLIDENNQKYFDTYLKEGVDIKKIHQDEADKTAAFWLGALSKTQKQKIQILVARYLPLESEVLQNRKEWLSQFKQILESAESSERKSNRLTTLFLVLGKDWSEEYKKSLDYNATLTLKMVEEVLAEATPRQQRFFVKRFKGWQNDLLAIHRNTPNEP